MRKKEWKLIITFSSTLQAIKVEKFCINNQINGRLIPVPKEITAGCGLAFKAEIKDREQIQEAFQIANLTYEDMKELEI